MKNSNNTIGNRTRDLPACSAVPQPTAPPRVPGVGVVMHIISEMIPSIQNVCLHTIRSI